MIITGCRSVEAWRENKVQRIPGLAQRTPGLTPWKAYAELRCALPRGDEHCAQRDDEESENAIDETSTISAPQSDSRCPRLDTIAPDDLHGSELARVSLRQ